MKTVGGRMRSDLSFSSTVTWNNILLPAADREHRREIEDAGRAVLAARAGRPDLTLEDHDQPAP
jgi:hypothetical protein